MGNNTNNTKNNIKNNIKKNIKNNIKNTTKNSKNNSNNNNSTNNNSSSWKDKIKKNKIFILSPSDFLVKCTTSPCSTTNNETPSSSTPQKKKLGLTIIDNGNINDDLSFNDLGFKCTSPMSNSNNILDGIIDGDTDDYDESTDEEDSD